MDTIRILLLEDAEFDAALIQRVLQRADMDFTATVAVNKEEYLHALQHDSFDVILADNSVPQFNALDAIEATREYKIDIPVILVTGTVTEDLAVKMIKAGTSDYILKDRLQRLPNAVLNAIEKHGLEIEKRKNLEHLIKSQALMKESERLAHLGSWELDLTTGITYWSDEKYRILGYDINSVPASFDNFMARVHEDDRDVVSAIRETVFNGAKSAKFECRIINTDGSLKYLRNEMFATYDEQEKLKCIHGFSIDITERKMGEIAQQMSVASLRMIFDNTVTGYALLDRSYNILSFNEAIYKFSAEQMAKPLELGKNAVEFFKPERQEMVKTVLYNALNGQTSKYDVPYPQADGAIRYFTVCSQPVMDNQQKVIGIIMSEVETTEPVQSTIPFM
jgi:PAS domain S-box-containing protein